MQIGDTNQSDAWTYNDELSSQTQTNQNHLAMTTTSLPTQHQPLHSRDQVESSIKEFSRLWPSRTERLPPTPIRFNDSIKTATIASNDLSNNCASNYLKRNGALTTGGVPLPPLTLQTEPNAWDLPSTGLENQNRK